MQITAEELRALGLVVAGGLLAVLVMALLLLAIVFWQVRRINVPPNASFAETLLYTPFLVVVAIDLLDLALDVLAAPFVWVILDRLGLKALRNVSAIEAAIPFTQFVPTLTLCWIGVRMIHRRIDGSY